MNLINGLLEILKTNQFFQGGISIGILGTIAMWGRRIPTQLFELFKRRFIIECDIPNFENEDQTFKAFLFWLSEHTYGKTVKKFTASTSSSDGTANKEPKLLLTPAPGDHWFWYRNRLIRLSRTREKSKVDGVLSNFHESLKLQTLGKNREVLESLIKETIKFHHKTYEGFTRIFSMDQWGNWGELYKIRKRVASSMVLDEGVYENLLADIRSFRENRKWYSDISIPYRRGYLFYGPPGTGKSSLALTLAGELDYDISVLSLNERQLSDNGLLKYFCTLPENSILLIEDIDCLYDEERQSKGTTPVTLSGLMNAIDGVAAKEGLIVVMTTNYKDRLDPALIRAGRVDVNLLLDLSSGFQVGRFFKRFYPHATEEQVEEFISKVGHKKHTPASIQQYLLFNKSSIDDALYNVNDLGLM